MPLFLAYHKAIISNLIMHFMTVKHINSCTWWIFLDCHMNVVQSHWITIVCIFSSSLACDSINWVFVSDTPNLSQITPSILSKNINTVTVKWTLPEYKSGGDYYTYMAQVKMANGDFETIQESEVVHSSFTGTEGMMTITRLLPGTLYTLRIMPYRDIAVTTFGNSKREKGTPSMSIEVRTGKLLLYLNSNSSIT